MIALSRVVLSYQSVAAWIQTSFDGAGLLSEPGELRGSPAALVRQAVGEYALSHTSSPFA
ncbi:hypothetical protein [Streptomyces sp. NBC_00328]|uniref:hypothetical protein n=1 Tax=Streptomyces sp. NBC_00328 TaxID=2903646 RepID=UPI002E2CCCAE|nr:hypothetical protein [Streptomyces sp. NBC_00328]